MQRGNTAEIVDELMEALRFDRVTTGPGPERALAAGDAGPGPLPGRELGPEQSLAAGGTG
jgi:hypothetical protein